MKGQDGSRYRRPTPLQGKALEVVGHAIEYLVDSRLVSTGQETDWDREAIRILIHASREIFKECEVIQPRPGLLWAFLSCLGLKRQRQSGQTIRSDLA